MLKKLDLHDCHFLYELLIDPSVFPFVRQKPSSYDEFMFLTKQNIELEEEGKLIARTIVDEWGKPIGGITLHDLINNTGFLGTWLGKPYHGKGYNKEAKDAFFSECFTELQIEKIFMKIRKINERSKGAALKLPYAKDANIMYHETYHKINENEEVFDLFVVEKEDFLTYLLSKNLFNTEDESDLKEA